METVETECFVCHKIFLVDKKDLENQSKFCCPSCRSPLSEFVEMIGQTDEVLPIPFDITSGV